MASLTTLEKAQILDDAGTPLNSGSYSATSSNPAVASIGDGGGFTLAVLGQSAGTATITATRNADGETATLEVTVTSGAPFTISLGVPSPK